MNANVDGNNTSVVRSLTGNNRAGAAYGDVLFVRDDAVSGTSNIVRFSVRPGFLGRAFAGLREFFRRERERDAERARVNGPLSLDDSWTGGWYERRRQVAESLARQNAERQARPANVRNIRALSAAE
jgi:hypothetical protein